MEKLPLTPQKITENNFAPYGKIVMLRDKVELSATSHITDDADTAIKVIKAKKMIEGTPVLFFERHPLSTQTFIPMDSGVFVVAVAKTNSNGNVDFSTLNCFITDGTQGIQYKSDTWHMPFSAIIEDKTFAVIDRHPNNTDAKDVNILFHYFDNKEITISL